MATVKLFHADPYLTRFAGQVLRCNETEDGWAVELDQTAFYAESGGQPSDQGTLGGHALRAVEETAEGRILHYLSFPLTGMVEGSVDERLRRDHMQQHTGQHLLSAAFERLLDAETASWHLGAESCTVDLVAESLTSEQVDQVEAECNRVIGTGLPVVTHVVGADRIGAFPLRKAPKVNTNIRVVEIKGYDWSACAGTHVSKVSELGLLKIKSWEKNKRFTRVEFLVGNRALADYAMLDRLTRNLGRSLTIAVTDLPAFVERVQEEQSVLRKQVKLLRDQIIESEAGELISTARKVGSVRLVKHVFGGRSLDEVKLLAAKVAAHPSTVAVFGTRGAIPQILMHRSVDLRLDVGAIIKQVLPLIDGRGGGSPVQAQGGGSRGEALDAALEQAIGKIADQFRGQL